MGVVVYLVLLVSCWSSLITICFAGPAAVLVAGRMGSGKSTLCNNLLSQGGTLRSCYQTIDVNGEVTIDRKCFKEGAGIDTGETQKPKSKRFTIGSVEYSLIDTVGFGDRLLSEKEIKNKTSQAMKLAPHGFKTLIFLFDNRISQEIINFFRFFRSMFPGCEKHLLIVKNKEIHYYNKGIHRQNLNSLREGFPDFKDALDKGAQFVLINVNPMQPKDYKDSFHILANKISNITSIYRPKTSFFPV
jgi:GTP-binding protein EngB required for normal cell division